jgi:hypothetical protein
MVRGERGAGLRQTAANRGTKELVPLEMYYWRRGLAHQSPTVTYSDNWTGFRDMLCSINGNVPKSWLTRMTVLGRLLNSFRRARGGSIQTPELIHERLK